MDGPVNELVNPSELPAAVGFSHAVRAGAGQTVYLAGQVAQPGRHARPTSRSSSISRLGNLVTALRAAGGEPGDLVSLQVFVTSVAEYKEALPALGKVWRRHFGRHYPAMGLFGIAELFDAAAKVELMGVAVLKPPR